MSAVPDISQGNSRIKDLSVSICAVLIATDNLRPLSLEMCS